MNGLFFLAFFGITLAVIGVTVILWALIELVDSRLFGGQLREKFRARTSLRAEDDVMMILREQRQGPAGLKGPGGNRAPWRQRCFSQK